jgi:large subunit ribosomal protein L23
MANTSERKRGPKLEPHQIILRPLITEKGTHQSQHKSEKREHWAPAYSFEVNPWATKTEIKAAVEELFGVRVAKVRTQNRLGKQRRYRFKMGRLSNWKKAIVTLQPESPVIEFF